MRRGWLAAALAVGGSVAAASPLQVMLVSGHKERPLDATAPAGWPRLLYRVLSLQAFRLHAEDLARSSATGHAVVRLQLLDGGGLEPGEMLRIPRLRPDGRAERREVQVASGDTLASLGRRYRVAPEDLRRVNDHRFEILPYARLRQKIPTVQLGVAGLTRVAAARAAADRTNFLAETLLHELAHLGTSRSCDRDLASRYGPDMQHLEQEVLTPAAALAEGWSDFQAAWRLPMVGARIRSRPVRARIEIWETNHDDYLGPGRYRWIRPHAMHVADLLATSEGVAGVLLALARPDGRPDRILAAERSVRDDHCRHIGSLVAALAPGPARLEAALTQAWGRPPPPAAVRALLAGELPGGAAPWELPRSRDYRD